MLTVNALKELGADTKEGLGRCLNNEAFYLRMVNMGLKDGGFEKLKPAVDAGDMGAAFEAAHALKGILGNLSLTPLAEPVNEITEMLRHKEEADYPALVKEILDKKAAFDALL